MATGYGYIAIEQNLYVYTVIYIVCAFLLFKKLPYCGLLRFWEAGGAKSVGNDRMGQEGTGRRQQS